MIVEVTDKMNVDHYLTHILALRAVDTSANSPVLIGQATLEPIIQAWAGAQLSSIGSIGSFAKSTTNRITTEIHGLRYDG